MGGFIESKRDENESVRCGDGAMKDANRPEPDPDQHHYRGKFAG